MEERLLNEKESLELITQMINSSKKNMEIGQGNYLLVWGYFTTALSIILFTLIALTHNMIWSWGWMLMFVMWPVMSYRQRQQPPRVITYTDKVIMQVWQVMGWMFVIAIYMLTMLLIGEKATTLWYLYFGLSFVFMMIIPGHIVNNKARKQCLKN